MSQKREKSVYVVIASDQLFSIFSRLPSSSNRLSPVYSKALRPSFKREEAVPKVEVSETSIHVAITSG
jgi:hypothetical protein